MQVIRDRSYSTHMIQCAEQMQSTQQTFKLLMGKQYAVWERDLSATHFPFQMTLVPAGTALHVLSRLFLIFSPEHTSFLKKQSLILKSGGKDVLIAFISLVFQTCSKYFIALLEKAFGLPPGLGLSVRILCTPTQDSSCKENINAKSFYGLVS